MWLSWATSVPVIKGWVPWSLVIRSHMTMLRAGVLVQGPLAPGTTALMAVGHGVTCWRWKINVVESTSVLNKFSRPSPSTYSKNPPLEFLPTSFLVCIESQEEPNQPQQMCSPCRDHSHREEDSFYTENYTPSLVTQWEHEMIEMFYSPDNTLALSCFERQSKTMSID